LTVKDIKRLKPAELNQDFFTRCGVANKEELRKMLRERLQHRIENQAKSEMADQIYKYLLDNTKIDLPDQVAAEQAVAVLRRQYINLMMQGVQREQIDEHIEQLKASSEEQAKQQLKVFFIMDKIAQNFKIETTDEEINGHIAEMAMQRKLRPERMKEEMQREGSLEQFKLQVREQKVIAKLLESANVTEVEPKPHKPAVHKETKHKAKEHKAEKKTEEKPAKKTAPKAESKEKAEKNPSTSLRARRPVRKKKT
jgi:trigger factor